MFKKFIRVPLIRTVGIYTIANILNAAIPFILLPFLTTYLTPKDYGLLACFQVLFNLALPFAGFNFDGAISRYYYEKDKININVFIGNALLILIFTSIVTCLIGIIFNVPIIRFIFSKEGRDISSIWIVIVIIMAFAQNIGQVVLNLWQVRGMAIKFSLFKVLRTFVEMILTFLFIIYIFKSWQERLIAQFITSLIFASISIYVLYKEKWVSFNVNREYIKLILLYGLPLVPHVVGGVLLNSIDKIVISRYLNLEATGIYTVGFQVGMIINLLCMSFNQAWVPFFFEKLTENNYNSKLRIVKFTYIYFIGIIAFAVLLSFFAPFIFNNFIGKSYTGGIKFVFWISLSFAFNGMYMMVVNYIFFIKKTFLISITTIVSAIINLILNIYFIKQFGVIGSAYASVITYFVVFVSIWILSANLYKMPWLFIFKKPEVIN